ncbi:Lrp/AsnC family transcriptional regulator [Clostridium frigoris]|uniref:siroheme decarboxylase n=1 Tax=Clostridium frigoris TaxID=205327 RepID=A0ABS6BYB0_9CLOT|nr:Lrp/AsnC family transcriptional regulator [Clostridium frigoris]MBU3161606.1 Lrp/AsnC family transcriptional regulator [Clostridium frigoris]
MDKISKDILNLIQSGFPIESRPFLKIAKELNISENQVIDIISGLKSNGYIKRIGGIFDLRKLGYYSTLCAIKVPVEKIEEVAKFINSNNGVTHNYIRNHSYNMWFTVIKASIEGVKEFLNDIKVKTGIEDIIELPVERLFKINVVFDIKE